MCVASLTLIFTRSVGTLQPTRPLGRVGSKFNWPSGVTAVSVAMSPHYRGSKYRSRLHPWSRKCACLSFCGRLVFEIELRQTGVICYLWQQRSWSCGVFTSWISDAHGPFQWKWQVLHNYDISVLQQVGMFFDRVACLMKVWPLFKREFPRVSMTWRSACARANFKCDVAYVNKLIRIEFRGVKCVSGECYQPYRENSSWYIRSDYLAPHIFMSFCKLKFSRLVENDPNKVRLFSTTNI